MDSIPNLGKVTPIIESNPKKRLKEKEEKITEAFDNVSNENEE